MILNNTCNISCGVTTSVIAISCGVTIPVICVLCSVKTPVILCGVFFEEMCLYMGALHCC